MRPLNQRLPPCAAVPPKNSDAPVPFACPMRSAASSGAKDRSSQVTRSSFVLAIADTAAVITKIAVSSAIEITAGLTQYRQDLISSRQCLG